MKRIAIYVRVSTDKQAKEGDSVPAQLSALKEYVQNHNNYVLIGEYIDDGISGTKFDKRNELQRLLDDVKKDAVDIILFTRMDRWFRSVRHYTATQEILDKYGVTWTAIWEPIYDTSTPAGRLIVNQMMSIAQFEAENTGQRIRHVMEYKRRRGEVLSGNVPFGYRIENKHLVHDGERAKIALETFKTYSRTSSIDETGRIMSGTGIPSHKTSLNAMLRNQTYIGKHNGLDNYCEPIIPEDLFYDVQRKLGMNIKTKKNKHTYIFSGLLRCGCCGRKMAGTTRRKEQKKYRCEYYYIANCENWQKPKERTIEEYLLQNIRDLIGEELRPREYEIGQDQGRLQARENTEQAKQKHTGGKEMKEEVKKWLVEYDHKDGRAGTIEVTTELKKSAGFDYGNGKCGGLTVDGYTFGYDLRYCLEDDLHKVMLKEYFGKGLVKATEI